MSAKAKQPALFTAGIREIEIVDVEDRKTDELVFGFVGPVGSGISLCANIFSDALKTQFDYTGDTIKVSEVINQSAKIIGENIVPASDEKRTEKLQRLGTKLREDFGNTYLIWPAPGSEDTELGVLMGPEGYHGETEVHAGVQA